MAFLFIGTKKSFLILFLKETQSFDASIFGTSTELLSSTLHSPPNPHALNPFLSNKLICATLSSVVF